MRILMVCLGNICRSPMAEAVLRALRPDWTVDSAGTGHWHRGEPPDERALAELARHGLRTTHRARQVTAEDYRRFDRLLAMDRQVLAELERRRPRDATARLELFDRQDVPDPYYEGPEAFAAVYEQIARRCRELAEESRCAP
ncbi:MAG: low molecular weight protein-tyrosine-phosphatase [Planctomycetota bacterium]|nr:low molecular weight phosphotyrosine protein phosphatase [Planctomycetota bacterium]MCX8040291.1 low molecular weight phosphotyrosine protein phosphatase [Planctomycetota bacterium]MDW8372414.1 low molecular weight protein-tyrosine-phosphatase [Planctomycetota bacterium]